MKKTLPFLSIIILLLAILTWQQFHMRTLIMSNHVLLEKVNLYTSQFKNLDNKFNQLKIESQKSNEANAAAYSESINYYKIAMTQLNEDLKQQVDIIKHGYKKENLLVFKLLDDTGKPYIEHYGFLPSETTDKNKIQYIANYLQHHYFENAQIEVKSIETIKGKRTAVINLSEKSTSTENKIVSKGWQSLYFQGSTGGSLTEMILIEGFLQKQLTKWPIDAVEFLYENKPIQFDHVPNLETVQYRN